MGDWLEDELFDLEYPDGIQMMREVPSDDDLISEMCRREEDEQERTRS